MPRIIVTTKDPHIPAGVGITLDEDVRTVHLSTGHAASQLVERIAWAVSDAEAQSKAERGKTSSNAMALR